MPFESNACPGAGGVAGAAVAHRGVRRVAAALGRGGRGQAADAAMLFPADVRMAWVDRQAGAGLSLNIPGVKENGVGSSISMSTGLP